MDKQQFNSKITDELKFQRIAAEMNRIAKARINNQWSQSHFFGRGRQKIIQDLYQMMAKDDFSLTANSKNNYLEALTTQLKLPNKDYQTRSCGTLITFLRQFQI